MADSTYTEISADEVLFRRAIGALPAAVYICDAEGLITYYNAHALEVWGRAPRLNDAADRFCGSFKLFDEHGLPVSHAECWMALAIRDRRDYLGREIVVERPDHTRVTVLAYVTPLLDEQQNVIKAINVLVDISPRKHLEQLQRKAGEAKEYYLHTLANAMREEMAEIAKAVAELQTHANQQVSLKAPVARLAKGVDGITQAVDQLVDRPAYDVEGAASHQAVRSA